MNPTSWQPPEPVPLPASQPSPKPPIGVTAATRLLFALGFAPLLVLFFLNLWERPHYQFFPLALVGALFLAWTRRNETLTPLRPGQPVLTILLLAASFALLAVATLLWSPWLGSIAALIGLAGLVWWAGGYAYFKSMLPGMLLLLVVIPPPLAADTRLVQHLRVVAVTWSSQVLDLLNVTHSLSGNVIELPGQQLLVDEACSGINSVLITLAACLFVGLWRRRSASHIILCLIGSLGFVLLGNMIRITLGAWLKSRYSIDILSARWHQATGLFLFAVYLVLVLSLDQLLVFLSKPTRPTLVDPMAVSVAADSRPCLGVPAFAGPAVGCAFALLGCAQLGLGWIRYQHAKAPLDLPKSALREGATFAMPEQIGNWKRLNTEVPPLQKVETRGVSSQIWHYRCGETLASIAIDYPFQGYHDVTVCYSLRGWDLRQQLARVAPSPNGSLPFEEIQMHNHVGLNGALWFSAVDEHGRWRANPSKGLKRSVLSRFRRPDSEHGITYQVQVLVTGFNPLTPADRERSEQLFQEARGMLWRQIFAQLRPKA
jgi:exosortase